MKHINVKVSVELAAEYCKAYRKRFPISSAQRLDDKSLLTAFVEDRLVEELEFIEDEMKTVDLRKSKKSSATQ